MFGNKYRIVPYEITQYGSEPAKFRYKIEGKSFLGNWKEPRWSSRYYNSLEEAQAFLKEYIQRSEMLYVFSAKESES